MKRTLRVILALLLCGVVAACGSTSGKSSTKNVASTAAATPAPASACTDKSPLTITNPQPEARIDGRPGTWVIGCAPSSDGVAVLFDVEQSGAMYYVDNTPVHGNVWEIRDVGIGDKTDGPSAKFTLRVFELTRSCFDKFWKGLKNPHGNAVVKKLPACAGHPFDVEVVVSN